MSFVKRIVFSGFALVYLIMITMIGMDSAIGETVIEINAAGEWVWDANGINTFEGKIIPEEDVSGGKITLNVSTRLEFSGEILFTSADGKKLKTKKRSASIDADLIKGKEYVFEGRWTLPENIMDGIAWAEISLQIEDAAGKKITVGKTEFGNRETDQAMEENSPLEKVEKLIMILGISGVTTWIHAIGRSLILKSNRFRKE